MTLLLLLLSPPLVTRAFPPFLARVVTEVAAVEETVGTDYLCHEDSYQCSL